MTPLRRCLPALLLLAACGGGDAPGATSNEPARDQPPVAIDPVPQMTYPEDLHKQGVEGRVVLRLFVDADGTVVPDSTRIQESSGVPGLDSAAVAGAPVLRFAPALRNGEPVATTFIQPIDFRRRTAP